jgi:hypothetical protein
MKKLLIILALVSAPVFASHTQKVMQTKVPVDHLYVPKGYDSNDNIELVVEGYLPNLCYKNPASVIDVKGKTVNVSIVANSTDFDGAQCAEMIVPFSHVFTVGLLDKGNYNVVVNGKHNTSLFVTESSSDAIDDEIYANVHQIEQIPGEQRVIVRGYHPSYCLEFDKFIIDDNGTDTYSVRPITKQISDFCPKKMIPFEYEMEVPSALKRNRVLIHVRSMNGNSVNSIYSQK